MSKILFRHRYKKAGQLYLLLVPLFEAFALPTHCRTSNAEAHAECYIQEPFYPIWAWAGIYTP